MLPDMQLRHAALVLSELEDRVGTTLQKDRNFLLWLPEYSAVIKNRYDKKDEYTPYYKVHGNDCHEK